MLHSTSTTKQVPDFPISRVRLASVARTPWRLTARPNSRPSSNNAADRRAGVTTRRRSVRVLIPSGASSSSGCVDPSELGIFSRRGPNGRPRQRHDLAQPGCTQCPIARLRCIRLTGP
jgi:hypothetical protein